MIMRKQFHIILRNRIPVHSCIHSRRENFRALAGKQRGGQHIIRNSVGGFGNYICGGRRHQKHVCLPCQRDMLHTVLKIPVKGIHQAFISRQLLKGNGIDKIRGVFRHNHGDVRFLLF